MKKVLILSVFAFFAFAVNAQTNANTSDKTTTEVAQTKDAGASAKSVALGGNAATAADKATNSIGCNDKTKSAACSSSKTADKGGKEACGKSAAACCSSKSTMADNKAGKAACCNGNSADTCSKDAKKKKD